MADDDDDWDNDDNFQQQPAKINQREGNGMGFFNRAPLQSQVQLGGGASKTNTMTNQSNKI